MASDAVLLAMQAPRGVPLSDLVEVISDPLIPNQSTTEMLGHFYDGLYDLRPESHLSRLLKVLLGDTGTGGLRKRYTYAHLSQVLLTTHFYDLDRFYADVLGLKRFIRERLDFDPYNEAGTAEEWEALMAADATYRARIEQFSRAIAWAATPTGMVLGASAVLGVPCRVYETYNFIDDEETYAEEEEATANTYGDLDAYTYAQLEGMTYGEMEGRSRFKGRLTNSRNEFVIRPLRPITGEERLVLSRSMDRIKPAEALMTIDPRGVPLHTRVPIYAAHSDSNYWHIRAQVAASEDYASLYEVYDDGRPVEQPKPAFSAYQGEAWSYSADVVSVAAKVLDPDGNVVMPVNHVKVTAPSGQQVEYQPTKALVDPSRVAAGRAVSDGVLVAPVVERTPA